MPGGGGGRLQLSWNGRMGRQAKRLGLPSLKMARRFRNSIFGDTQPSQFSPGAQDPSYSSASSLFISPRTRAELAMPGGALGVAGSTMAASMSAARRAY